MDFRSSLYQMLRFFKLTLQRVLELFWHTLMYLCTLPPPPPPPLARPLQLHCVLVILSMQ